MEIIDYEVFKIIFYLAPCVYINLYVLRALYRKMYTENSLFIPTGVIVFFFYLTLSIIPVLNILLMFFITDKQDGLIEAKKENKE